MLTPVGVSPLQGNDITLVARQSWQRRQQGGRETHRFEVVFREVSGSWTARRRGGEGAYWQASIEAICGRT